MGSLNKPGAIQKCIDHCQPDHLSFRPRSHRSQKTWHFRGQRWIGFFPKLPSTFRPPHLDWPLCKGCCCTQFPRQFLEGRCMDMPSEGQESCTTDTDPEKTVRKAIGSVGSRQFPA